MVNERMNQIEGSTCVITGANSGIGKAAASEMARHGARVVMVCRSRERGRQALVEVCQDSGSSSVDLMIADLSVQQEVKDLAARIAAEYPQVDVLVNNAGLFKGKRELTVDGLETTFAVNHMAYFILTLGLMDTLKASAPARIINVASDSHKGNKLDFDDLQAEQKWSGFKAYGRSKLANILFTGELARRLEGSGITANSLHPGVVDTGFWRPGNGAVMTGMGKVGSRFMRTPEDGAKTTLHLATSPDLDGVTGGYYANEKAARPSTAALDQEAAALLWTRSLELAGYESDPLG
ncbi:MAG: NAD(P)-dependent dehydrogenase (short-subunit alcohol dehydrogenase family) [Rhodothermales bacterium]|jgi:NAD(P)-dependent dehydrogenase (short-subunit alcohol dehydrogenase family)